MNKQISMMDLLVEQEKKIEIPVPAQGEKTYTIHDDVWEGRCKLCVHKNAEKNVPIPISAVHRRIYEEIIPCRIMAISRPNDRPGECMSFTPRIDVYGICATCKQNAGQFHEGFCFRKTTRNNDGCSMDSTTVGMKRKLTTMHVTGSAYATITNRTSM